MPNILELFDQKSILDYVNNRQYPALLGEQLFPERKVQGLEFDMLKGGSKVPIIASVHAFDTEAEIGSREASKQAMELAFIKRKMQLREKDLIALRNPRTPAEQAFLEKQVYHDLDVLIAGVRARVEAMRMEALAEGTITLDENNLEATISYHVPKDHQEELVGETLWSEPTSDPIEDLTRWSETLDGVPTRILTSTPVRSALLKHPKVLKLFKTVGVLPTIDNLNSVLSQLGLPKIAVYDQKYRKQQADGAYQIKRYFPSNRLVMMGDELLGETLYGDTPEESRLLASGSNDYKVGQVFATLYESNLDPVGTWIKAAATAFPSFPAADEVFQAKVL